MLCNPFLNCPAKDWVIIEKSILSVNEYVSVGPIKIPFIFGKYIAASEILKRGVTG